ncbi:hypothetical protein FEM48_Zijuj03G0111600 [Ziziphus jujuba var. spinosa]|uniref:Cation/H(+) antiporter 15-like n=1 Tax=Ziziphus jujuba var. spinosa TaxID=714518 RepID=A0A978VPY9_ZIZJJ|nr:cation/H(+) antiporter 15-like [Ziziphus jujuba var. spinosa]KAH7537614.1 hypothetical protein FEM48_Zijuj03G0111600 [Ziziphus jujuba var. spinosa]
MATFGNDSSSAYGHQHTSLYKGRHELICLPEQEVRSRGIFNGDNPFDYVCPVVFTQIFLYVLFSRLIYLFLRPLGQSKFVCNVLAGIILGPSVLGRIDTLREKLFPPRESEFLSTAASIGSIYSIFLIAVKMDMDIIVRAARNAWRIGITGFVLPLIVSYASLRPLADKFQEVMKGTFLFYVALSLSFSYFPVIAESLQELNLVNSELGHLAMSSAMLNDVIQWFFIALSVILRQENTGQAVGALVCFLALVFLSVQVIRPAVVMVIKNTPEGKPVREIYIITLLVGVLVMAFLSDIVLGSSMAGPLFLGLAIPDGPPLGAALVEKSEYIISEFFMPLFFMHVGYTVELCSVKDWRSFHRFQFTFNVGCLAKLFGTMLAALCCKIKFRNALLLGLIMNVKGILEIIVFHKWKSMKYIDEQTYTQLVVSTVAITFLVAPLIKLLSNPQSRLGPVVKHRGLRTLNSIPRNSEFRVLCCVHHEEGVNSIVKLLEAASASISSPICSYIIHAVELVGRTSPLLLPFHSHRRQQFRPAISTKSETIFRAFENYTRVSKGHVSVQPYTMIAPYKTMHETLCRLSHDKLIPLIIVPFHQNQQYLISRSVAASIHQFNVNLQMFAPCTVGILVNRSFTLSAITASFSYRVAVIFNGGPDDREALAFASRMSDHEDVSVTVVRIINLWTTKNGYQESEDRKRERKMDDAAVEEFKMKSVENEFVVWKEVEAEDDVEVVNGIRSLQSGFDLVMVGRRRWNSAETVGDDEISDFVENPELGVIGDMLASADFWGGMVSVLVMQSCGGVRAKGSTRSNSMKLYYVMENRKEVDSSFG